MNSIIIDIHPKSLTYLQLVFQHFYLIMIITGIFLNISLNSDILSKMVVTSLTNCPNLLKSLNVALIAIGYHVLLLIIFLVQMNLKVLLVLSSVTFYVNISQQIKYLEDFATIIKITLLRNL
jgi:hypothetical protein